VSPNKDTVSQTAAKLAGKFAVPESVNHPIDDGVRATSTRSSLFRPFGSRALSLGLAGLLVMSGASGALATGGGGGGVPGTGTGSSGSFHVYNTQYDGYSGNVPDQGYMAASTEWFINSFAANGPNGGNTSMGTGAMDQIRAACSSALAKAEARGGNQGLSRVVSIMWAGSSTSPWASSSSASASFFQQRWDGDVVGAGFPGIYVSQTPAYMQQFWPEALAEGGATPSAVCIALNQNEPPRQYDLSITTDKNAAFTVSGGTQAVSDTIHASNGGSAIIENVTADVVLHWDGVEGNARHVSKTVSIANNGDTQSPNFTPADFGWSSWPQGNFWFDVIVTQQGMMGAAINTPDRDARESFALTPTTPTKKLWASDMSRELTDQDVLASGMMHNAVVTAQPNGYASSMTLRDRIDTDKVFIGAKDKDVASAVYVLNPDGTKVSGAKINIDRADGKVSVSATVANIPNRFQNLDFRLVVPTYVLPTKADYIVKDLPQVCYTADEDDCLDGPPEQTRKVTPVPDKVWVLDENGALTTADPDRTNKEGADEKVFLMGEAVAAVVNGKVKGKLVDNLTNYQIRDDWTKAAKYVDFSDVSKAKVFYETAPGSKKYTDVTNQFDVKITGTVTEATAKPVFLSQTKGQSADRSVKLVISGNFRTDYATKGETVVLYNDGSETWNDETIETNEPPVYTWTPDPEKQVIGSGVESGDKTHENINGLSVWPGQWLEYSIGVDLNIPGGLAYGVKSLVVEDQYDPLFLPVKSSVEFWDARDAKSPKPLPKSAYKLTWDDKKHMWTATFTDEWLKKNLDAGSQWLTKGWLTARFHGVVSKDAKPGQVIKNQAFEIINNARTSTEVPEVKIPKPEPEKEDLSTDGINIDGKTVVLGDTIVYRLTLDASVKPEELAYYVHKLGMVDDYDEEYLKLNLGGVRITNIATGADVTKKFNLQDRNGVFYGFAKQVDSTGPNGNLIKGDPQPTDLRKYSSDPILPASTPIIDQSLMGHKYYITLPMKVIKVTDGYTIKNRAVENIENASMQTRIVSNPLKEINPEKDVTIKAGGKDSINGQEVALNEAFNYQLSSSEIPANRAYEASQWSITDTFDRVHDQYTGKWAVYANTDLYDGKELVAKKGALLQNSAGKGISKEFFTASFDEKSYTFNISAEKPYFDLVNSRGDLPQAWSVYTQMIRIQYADKVVNTFTESYNGQKRKSNEVWTTTPPPAEEQSPKEPGAELAKTGGDNALMLWGAVAALMVAGGAVAAAGMRKRRLHTADVAPAARRSTHVSESDNGLVSACGADPSHPSGDFFKTAN
jgi:adhesin isopeptide-forming family sspB-C2 type protein